MGLLVEAGATMVARGGVGLPLVSGVMCGTVMEVVGVGVGRAGLAGTVVLGCDTSATFASILVWSRACFYSEPRVTGGVLAVLAAANATCLSNIESADSLWSGGRAAACPADYIMRSFPLSVAATIRWARPVSPLGDGGAESPGPEVAVLTRPSDGRRSITFLEMVGAHVVGGAGVAGVVAGGFGFVLEGTTTFILAVMRRSNIWIMAFILVSCFRA